MNAAEEGLHSFLSRMPAAARERFGFSESDNLAEATLGDPFNLFVIHPEAVLDYSPSEPIENILTTTNLWYFPVRIRQKTRCLLIVDFIKDEWRTVSLGAASLAQEVEDVREAWPETEGYRPEFIAVRQAGAYLFSVPALDKSNLTMLAVSSQTSQSDSQTTQSHKPSETDAYKRLSNIDSTLSILRPAVERNLKHNH